MCPGPGLHWSWVMQQGQEAFRIHDSCAFELNAVNSGLEPRATVSTVREAVWWETGGRDKTVLWMAESSQHRRMGPAGSSGRVNKWTSFRVRTKGANLGNRRDQFLGAKSWRNMWPSLRGKRRGGGKQALRPQSGWGFRYKNWVVKSTSWLDNIRLLFWTGGAWGKEWEEGLKPTQFTRRLLRCYRQNPVLPQVKQESERRVSTDHGIFCDRLRRNARVFYVKNNEKGETRVILDFELLQDV